MASRSGGFRTGGLGVKPLFIADTRVSRHRNINAVIDPADRRARRKRQRAARRLNRK